VIDVRIARRGSKGTIAGARIERRSQCSQKPVPQPRLVRPNADPPKRKRRRFQFSLRTLMVGVTLLAVACGYVALEARIAKERREAAEIYEPLREIVTKVWGGRLEYSSRTVLIEAPWPLRWFGEDGYKAIMCPSTHRQTKWAALRDCFQKPRSFG
jgi:hypothetical protein